MAAERQPLCFIAIALKNTASCIVVAIQEAVFMYLGIPYGGGIRNRSGNLHQYAFDPLAGIIAFVGNDFQHLVDLRGFDQIAGGHAVFE